MCQLVRAVERSLALSGRWSAWERVLNLGLEAAQALEDPAAEGWALHQLGTRALCLGDAALATSFLSQALEIRRGLGDSEGVAVTRHNLERLGPVPPEPEPSDGQPPSDRFPRPPGPRIPRLLRWLLGIGIPVLLVVLGGGTWYALQNGVAAFEPGQAVDFAAVPLGETGTASLRIHNTGSRSLRLGTIGAGGEFMQTNDCPIAPALLRPDRSCTIHLTFTRGASGARSGTLTVTESDGNAHAATLTGIGTASRLSFKPGSVDFGDQTVGLTSPERQITLQNSGNSPFRSGC